MMACGILYSTTVFGLSIYALLFLDVGFLDDDDDDDGGGVVIRSILPPPSALLDRRNTAKN